MTAIEQAFELQKRHDMEERFERLFFEGCLKSGIIKTSDVENENSKYLYLKELFEINNSSINLYRLSEQQSEIIDTEEEMQERLSIIFKLLSKKMSDTISFHEF